MNKKELAYENRNRLAFYLTKHFEKVDAGKVEIPPFIKAKNLINQFRQQGILSGTYKFVGKVF
ncbi:hypothetical protein IJ750_02665 [bacterium]|nr:hypothetical protein [bacterium]